MPKFSLLKLCGQANHTTNENSHSLPPLRSLKQVLFTFVCFLPSFLWHSKKSYTNNDSATNFAALGEADFCSPRAAYYIHSRMTTGVNTWVRMHTHTHTQLRWCHKNLHLFVPKAEVKYIRCAFGLTELKNMEVKLCSFKNIKDTKHQTFAVFGLCETFVCALNKYVCCCGKVAFFLFIYLFIILLQSITKNHIWFVILHQLQIETSVIHQVE